MYFNCPRKPFDGFIPTGNCQARAEARTRLTDKLPWSFDKRESFDEEMGQVNEIGKNGCNIYKMLVEELIFKENSFSLFRFFGFFLGFFLRYFLSWYSNFECHLKWPMCCRTTSAA